MAVRLEGRIHRYIGLSTDIKPYPGLFDADGHEMTAGDLPPGSTFLASDTGAIWRWTGQDWEAADSPEVLELRTIRGLLTEMLGRLPVAPF